MKKKTIGAQYYFVRRSSDTNVAKSCGLARYEVKLPFHSEREIDKIYNPTVGLQDDVQKMYRHEHEQQNVDF